MQKPNVLYTWIKLQPNAATLKLFSFNKTEKKLDVNGVSNEHYSEEFAL